MLSDATTSAAAGAVAVAKAAAAASMAIFTRGGPAQAKATAGKPAEPAPSDTVSEEPVTEAKSPVQAKPVEKPAVPKKAPINGGDDLQRIRAIDAETERQLKELGVNYFEHIAAWTSPDVKRISQVLKIPGRIDREQWVEQAQILAKGGETYYSRNRLAAQKAQAEEPASTAASDEHEADEHEADEGAVEAPVLPAVDVTEAEEPEASEPAPASEPKPTQLSGMDAVRQGRSVAEMASAAAAAIAAASASVTRGLKPIEPISPLSRVDPKISIPAKLSDAIKERVAASTSQFDKEEAEPEKFEQKPIAGGNGPADDLKRIRGIGVLIEKRLNAMGVTRYEHVANWTSGDIDRISQVLEFRGRIERESWVEQARILSSGGQTEFSRRVDRGEFDTSRDT
jgi:predicted flap endonuclease-1-like 5' DNA nuclease